jgi:hypothetical protein
VHELEGMTPSTWRYHRADLGSQVRNQASLHPVWMLFHLCALKCVFFLIFPLCQDDPEKREFYLFQVKISEGEFEVDRAYRCDVLGKTLPGRPLLTLESLGVDEEGRLLFPRRQPDGSFIEMTALSPADEPKLCSMPSDLLGHTLIVSVYMLLGKHEKLVHTKRVEYQLPSVPASGLRRSPIASPGNRTPSKEYVYSITSQRSNRYARHSSPQASSPYSSRGGDRPRTAPSVGASPARGGVHAVPSYEGSPSRPISRGSLQGSPSKWDSALPPHREDDAASPGGSPESPGEKKRRELALMRAQMKVRVAVSHMPGTLYPPLSAQYPIPLHPNTLHTSYNPHPISSSYLGTGHAQCTEPSTHPRAGIPAANRLRPRNDGKHGKAVDCWIERNIDDGHGCIRGGSAASFYGVTSACQ